MIIIAGYTLTEAERRDRAVAAHAEMVGRARAHEGCIDLAISADAQFAAYDTATNCYGVNLSARTNWLLAAVAPTSHSHGQFSGDGQHLAYLAKDNLGTNQVYLYDFANAAKTLVSPSYDSAGGGNGACDSPAIDAAGRFS